MFNVLYFVLPTDDINVRQQLRVLRLVQNAVRSFQDNLLQKVFCVCDTLAIFLISCSLLYHTGIKAIVQLEFCLPRVIKSCFSLCFRIFFPEVLSTLGWAWKCYGMYFPFILRPRMGSGYQLPWQPVYNFTKWNGCCGEDTWVKSAMYTMPTLWYWKVQNKHGLKLGLQTCPKMKEKYQPCGQQSDTTILLAYTFKM